MEYQTHRQTCRDFVRALCLITVAFIGNGDPNDNMKCRHPLISNGKAELLFQRALPVGEYSDYYIEDTPVDDLGNYYEYDNLASVEYSQHTELKVQCNQRYAFNGSRTYSGVIVCMLVVTQVGTTIATWSGDPESVCAPVMCHPMDIFGGILTSACDDEAQLVGPVIIRQTACLRCKMGYEMTDEEQRRLNAVEVMCGVDGQWMMPANCTNAIACPELLSPNYGELSSFNRLNHAIFRCHERFIVVGRDRLECELGKWNGNPPLCRFRASCLTNNLRNGVIVVEPAHTGRGPWAKPNATATYRCLDGYKTRTPNNVIRCRRGKWHPEPRCKAVLRCNPLRHIIHGSVVAVHGSKFLYGSVYRFTCQRGYVFIGEGDVVDVTCSGNGEWSRKEPKCSIVNCPELRAPRHGTIKRIRGSRFEYNARYAFGCLERYRLGGMRHGEETLRTCNAAGRWTGENRIYCEARKIFLSREEWASFLSSHLTNCCQPKRELQYEWDPGCPLKQGVMSECIHPPWYKTDSTCYYREIREYDMPERVDVWYALLGVKVERFHNRCCWVSDRLPPYQCYEGPWLWHAGS